jgi:hypothetical protein
MVVGIELTGLSGSLPDSVVAPVVAAAQGALDCCLSRRSDGG